MKNAVLPKLAILAACLGFACIDSHTTTAQQPSPQTPNQPAASRPASAARAKTEFGGQFSLPYEVQCAGLKLAAGAYGISLDRHGKSQTVILTRAGQSVRLTAKAAFPASRRGGSAVLVRRSGLERKLEAVYVEKLHLVVYLDSEQFLQASGDAQVERLPIS